jgi:hypothetical protein
VHVPEDPQEAQHYDAQHTAPSQVTCPASLLIEQIHPPYRNGMSSPSPGPGWWLATDGKWYPQRWEYKYHHQWDDSQSVNGALAEMQKIVAQEGQEGWEMVNFTILSFSSDAKGYTGVITITGLNNRNWTIAWVMKRPIAQ